MSLVTTTRSQRSRIDLQSISTSVVLPEPTGPPTPTRRGGNGLVRPGIACSRVLTGSSPCFALRCEPPGRARSVPGAAGRVLMRRDDARSAPGRRPSERRSGAEEARVLRLVASAEDRKARHEALPRLVVDRQGRLDRARNRIGQQAENALP